MHLVYERVKVSFCSKQFRLATNGKTNSICAALKRAAEAIASGVPI